jgi:protein SCO1/2
VRNHLPSCCLLGLLALVALWSVPGQAQEPRPATLAQTVGIDQHLGEQLPLEVRVRDESGRERLLADFFGDKPVVLNFVYYRCPMLCTQVLNGVLRASQAIPLEIGRDYEIVTISVDPRETAEIAAAKKATYVGAYRRGGADRGWHFLTADQRAIAALTTAAGFRFQYDPRSDQFAHASGIMLVTPEGRLSRYLYGIDYEPADLRLGLVESSSGRIGTAVDQLLLLCFHYDPATGKYGLVISRVLQIAGIATTLALGSFLWIMFRREWRYAKQVRPVRSVDWPAGAD